jgi:protocatechuate 3,4-dioxygenase beta subunit
MTRADRRFVMALALVAVVVLMLLLLQQLAGRVDESRRTESAPLAISDAWSPQTLQGVAPVPVQPLALEPTADGPAAAAVETGPEEGSLLIHVTWGSDGTPATDVSLGVLTGNLDYDARYDQRARTDGEGTALVKGLSPGRVIVRGDRGGKLEAQVTARARTEVSLVIPPGALVRGRVVDERAQPVAHADIWLSWCHADWSERPLLVGPADGNGGFLLRDVAPEFCVSARAKGSIPSELVPVGPAPRQDLEVTLVLRDGGSRLSGTVRDPGGLPVPAATVELGFNSATATMVSDSMAHPRPMGPVLTTDAAGLFSVDDLPPGRTSVAVNSPGFTTWSGMVALEAGGSQHIDVTLGPPAVLWGVVRDGAGGPVPGAEIVMQDATTRTDEQGHYELVGAPIGTTSEHSSRVATITVTATSGHARAKSEFGLRPGDRVEWSPTLAVMKQVTGRVVNEKGEPFSDCVLCARGSELENFCRKLTHVAADGSFAFENCDAARYLLTAWEEETGDDAIPVASLDGVKPGEPVELVIDSGRLSTARIVGRIQDLAQRPLADAVLTLMSEPTQMGYVLPIEAVTGAFRSNLLPPGDYSLLVQAPGMATQTLQIKAVQPQEVRDLGTIVMALTGSVRVNVQGMPSGPEDQVWLGIEDATGRIAGAFEKPDDGTWRSTPMSPGNYYLQVGSQGRITNQTIPFRIESAHEAVLDVTVAVGVPFQLLPRYSDALRLEPGDAMLTIVREDGGALVYRGRWERYGVGLALPAGEYVLTATKGVHAMPPTTLSVQEGMPAKVTVDFS